MPRASPSPPGDLHLYSECSAALRRSLQRRIQAGQLHRIAPGVVTSLAQAQWPRLVERERARILAQLFPGAVIGYRSAFAGSVPVDGVLHLNYRYSRTVQLPGLTVVLRKNKGRAPGDEPIAGGALYVPSLARTLLENLCISRSAVRKSAGAAAVAVRLEALQGARGDTALIDLRQEARPLAEFLGLARELRLLEGMIARLLEEIAAPAASAPVRAPHALGLGFDPARVATYDALAARLRTAALAQPPSPLHSAPATLHCALLEATFSGQLAGLRFPVALARATILEGRIPEEHSADAHELLGVFRQIMVPTWRSQVLEPGPTALAQLRQRHADLMAQSTAARPGCTLEATDLSDAPARVVPDLLIGTFERASALLRGVPAGTARALFVHFLLTDLHPFVDANGRVARLLMNAELSAVKACRLLVPPSLGTSLAHSLHALSHGGDAGVYLDCMQEALRWSAGFDYEDLDRTLEEMAQGAALVARPAPAPEPR